MLDEFVITCQKPSARTGRFNSISKVTFCVLRLTVRSVKRPTASCCRFMTPGSSKAVLSRVSQQVMEYRVLILLAPKSTQTLTCTTYGFQALDTIVFSLFPIIRAGR